MLDCQTCTILFLSQSLYNYFVQEALLIYTDIVSRYFEMIVETFFFADLQYACHVNKQLKPF